LTALKIILAAVFTLIGINLFLWSFMKRRIARAKAEALAEPDLSVTGGCHCGAVRYRFATRRHVNVSDCNCSMCSRSGYLHLIVGHAKFELLTPREELIGYRFNTGTAEHLFCKTCGIKSVYQPRSHADSWSVNWRCLDEGHGLIETILPFDGQNWEAARPSLAD
jgi:hypothetical protein